jgi:hypothetical protein
MIVTPFAQLLASLKNVRKNFVDLTHIPPERYDKFLLILLYDSLINRAKRTNQLNPAQTASANLNKMIAATTTTTTPGIRIKL